MQVLMRGIDLGAPQRVGMGPQHGFWTRRRARCVLHAARGMGIGGAARPVGAVGEQSFELFCVRHRVALCRSGAGIVGNDGHPAQVAAVVRDQFGVGGLGDSGDRAAMVGEIFHLGGGRAGVGGDGDGTELHAGEPCQHRFDAVVQMDEDVFAGLYAPLREPRCERADPVVKLAIAPAPRRGIERRPDQERVVTANLGAHFQQPRHVQSREWPHHAGCCS